MSINNQLAKLESSGDAGVARELGPRLRAARLEAGVGVRELARKIGVSPGLISQVEGGRTAPSVGTLYSIATALGLSLDYLFDSGGEAAARATSPRPISVQLESHRPTVRLASGVRWERLTWSQREDFEFLHVVYEPESTSCGEGELLQHGGEEFALLLTGTLDLKIGTEYFKLAPGDSISFDAQIPHRIWNAGKVPAAAVWVVLQRRFDDRVS